MTTTMIFDCTVQRDGRNEYEFENVDDWDLEPQNDGNKKLVVFHTDSPESVIRNVIELKKAVRVGKTE